MGVITGHYCSDVMLIWETANEIGTSHFEIERSFDGRLWSGVGKVAAAGYSSSYLSYQFFDKNVHAKDAPPAKLYYRLRMVDLDGGFEYSIVRLVSFDGHSAISIYPNPTSWGVEVDVQPLDVDAGELQIQVYSMEGRLVFEKLLGTTGGLLYFPDHLSEGVYQIIINGEPGREDFYQRLVLVR